MPEVKVKVLRQHEYHQGHCLLIQNVCLSSSVYKWLRSSSKTDVQKQNPLTFSYWPLSRKPKNLERTRPNVLIAQYRLWNAAGGPDGRSHVVNDSCQLYIGSDSINPNWWFEILTSILSGECRSCSEFVSVYTLHVSSLFVISSKKGSIKVLTKGFFHHDVDKETMHAAERRSLKVLRTHLPSFFNILFIRPYQRHGEARQRETKSKTKPNRITEQKFSVTAAQDRDRHKDRTGEGDDYLVWSCAVQRRRERNCERGRYDSPTSERYTSAYNLWGPGNHGNNDSRRQLFSLSDIPLFASQLHPFPKIEIFKGNVNSERSLNPLMAVQWKSTSNVHSNEPKFQWRCRLLLVTLMELSIWSEKYADKHVVGDVFNITSFSWIWMAGD